MVKIDKTAIVEDGVELGVDVEIGPYSIIRNGVKINDKTKIDSHCMIEGNTFIGKNNQIFSHATIGSIPQDLKYHGEYVELIIGDNNKIREFVLFNPGTEGGGGKTIIGNNNLFMGYVHIAHDCIIGNNCIFANVATLAGHVEIDDFAVVGGLSAIHQFCKIGEMAMLGGGSIVVQDIPPYCITEGNRAIIRGLNLTGLRRNLENRGDIDEIKKAYKELFEKPTVLKDTALKLLKSNNKFVKKMANFVLNSKRGIPFKKEVK